MSNELAHHGINGQKWGVRRFQNPDGSLTPLGKLRYNKTEGRSESTVAEKTTKTSQKNEADGPIRKSKRKVHEMSDDELRSRIGRLEMERRYLDLEAQMKKNNTSPVKRLLTNSVESLAEQSLNRLVSTIVGRVFDKKDSFDMDEYKDMDVYEMNSDTIKKVADWYSKATLITKQRSALSSEPAKSAQSQEKARQQTPEKSRTEVVVRDSPTPRAENTKSHPSSSNASEKLPWVYRASGSAAKKAQKRAERENERKEKSIEKDRKKRDREKYEWLL